MAITVEGARTECATTLKLHGRIDGNTAPELEQICLQWIGPQDRNLVFDFSGVAYISSAGLSTLLRAGKAMDAQGGRLLLCGLSARVKQVILFSGFDALFPLFESLEAALEDCRQHQAK